eukprot:TRINITY_DN12988_c0_g1_i1.p1 TRINITY_DN12988_c0_g1~~TRINITY_DN12988_c0_g1_i1.p1  ORF type:complete len:152 (-),score=13.16 TRINITY_DN12988_c0_g1_i1:288-743(-)
MEWSTTLLARRNSRASLRRKASLSGPRFTKNFYGTSIADIVRIQNLKKIPFLDIDIQGVLSVHKHPDFRSSNFVFISPPSVEELERRLKARGTETEDTLRTRLSVAKKEIETAMQSGIYKKENIIVNDELDTATTVFVDLVRKLYPNLQYQ